MKDFSELLILTENALCSEEMKRHFFAAKNGDALSQVLLGDLFCGVADGVGDAVGDAVGVDFEIGASWYLEAAQNGHARGAFCVGICYYLGDGVAVDFAAAEKWLERAARLGEVEAQAFLGWCYYHGVAIGKNRRKAASWLKKAAKSGNQAAIEICTRVGYKIN